MQKGKMQLSPNPSSGKVRILLGDMQLYDTRISVYDKSGRLLLSRTISRGQHPEIDLSGLAGGIYMMKAEQNGRVFSQKLVSK